MWLTDADRLKMKAIIAQYGGTQDPNKDSAEMNTVTHKMVQVRREKVVYETVDKMEQV